MVHWTVNKVTFLKLNFEQPSLHIGMGSSPLTLNFHEERDDRYCDLPNTFVLDGFSFKRHS